MARITRKQLKQDEFVDTAVDFGQWLEENWRTVAKWGGVLVVVLAIGLVWSWTSSQSRAKGRTLLAEGMVLFQDAEEAGFADEADVTAALERFEEAADRSGGSGPGLSARFYQAVALHQLGRSDEAIAPLEQVAGAPDRYRTLAGSAVSLLAEVLVAAGQADRAVSLLEETAQQAEPSLAADQALLQLGRIHEARGSADEARRVWQRIVDEFPASPGAQQATRLLQS